MSCIEIFRERVATFLLKKMRFLAELQQWNYTNPWVINEVYYKADNVTDVLATFGTTADALLDVITGKFNPSGKMPFTTPVSDLTVENQKEDVPGYTEGEGYALFNYDEGSRYVTK
jgi:beta-glucosidase